MSNKLEQLYGDQVSEEYNEEAPHGYKKNGKARKRPKGQGWDKFKEGFGDFGLPILENLASLVPGVGPQLSNAIDDLYVSDAEKEELKAGLATIELEQQKVDLEDRKSAREMQIAALQQTDKFSKRWIYVLAAATIAAVVGLITMLFFVDIPDANRSIIDVSLGAFIGAALSIYTFFYGSSDGSKSKTDGMIDIIKTNSAKG